MIPQEWTLLAPGPSLKNLRPDLFKPTGPVVAINTAILAPVPVDFWCCQDPVEKFESTTRIIVGYEHKPMIWCKEHLAYAWNALGFRTWTHPSHEAPFKTQMIPVRAPQVCFTSLTITTALARIVGHGAQQIIVYGCDMAGEGYSFGVDARNRASAVWRKRWEEERRILTQVSEYVRGLGLNLEFRTMEK